MIIRNYKLYGNPWLEFTKQYYAVLTLRSMILMQVSVVSNKLCACFQGRIKDWKYHKDLPVFVIFFTVNIGCRFSLVNIVNNFCCITHFSISDIDECHDENGGCYQICENLPGSHNCSCYTGYKLSSDKRTCEGILMRQCSCYHAVHHCPMLFCNKDLRWLRTVSTGVV